MEDEALRIIRAADCITQAWANGGGRTREIIRWPETGDWAWRLSIAEVVEAAPFSRFEGVDRTLVLLSGAGLKLAQAGAAGEDVVLDTPYDRHDFPGERAIIGEPLGGITFDFNLMWRRDRIAAESWVRPMVGALTVFAQPGEAWAVHLAAGRMHCEGAVELAAGDTLILAAGDAGMRQPVQGSGTAIFMRLRARSQSRTEHNV